MLCMVHGFMWVTRLKQLALSAHVYSHCLATACVPPSNMSAPLHVLQVLECAPLPPALVHRSLRCAITSGTVIAQLDTSQSPCATAADLETATAEAVEAGGSPATAPLPATAQEAGGQDTPIPDAEGGAVQKLGPGGMEGVQRQRGAGEDQGQSVAMQPAQPGLKLLRTVYADRVKYAAVAVVQMQGQGAAGGAGVVRGPQPATVGA